MNAKPQLNYVEFATLNIQRSKAFFSEVFGWEFTDYGEAYSAFTKAGLEGGLFSAQRVSQAQRGAPLLVFYSSDIKQTQREIEQAGGAICKPLFNFPGGCRFHFVEPGGNELAVWSESI
ncbi:VOC family protein [Alteromonas sp. D210916BOD_24]|uniref:VOC family protein n=1 Tax=Alteromonas sp. D210916BOD_24 TaxID=3157618 RepID=UPI00399CDB04